MKLFWKEVREDMIPQSFERTVWDDLPAASIDTTKLEHLFESRAKELLVKVCIKHEYSDYRKHPFLKHKLNEHAAKI